VVIFTRRLGSGCFNQRARKKISNDTLQQRASGQSELGQRVQCRVEQARILKVRSSPGFLFGTGCKRAESGYSTSSRAKNVSVDAFHLIEADLAGSGIYPGRYGKTAE